MYHPLYYAFQILFQLIKLHQRPPIVSLSKKLYSNCLVLVGSRNGFERDLHKQKHACFTIELK